MNEANWSGVKGERRRVLVTGSDPVGRDAVVAFADLDRPAVAYRAVVYRGQAPGGLKRGDQCILRFREAQARRPNRRAGLPAGWDFVERTEEAHVDFDAEVEAMTEAATA